MWVPCWRSAVEHEGDPLAHARDRLLARRQQACAHLVDAGAGVEQPAVGQGDLVRHRQLERAQLGAGGLGAGVGAQHARLVAVEQRHLPGEGGADQPAAVGLALALDPQLDLAQPAEAPGQPGAGVGQLDLLARGGDVEPAVERQPAQRRGLGLGAGGQRQPLGHAPAAVGLDAEQPRQLGARGVGLGLGRQQVERGLGRLGAVQAQRQRVHGAGLAVAPGQLGGGGRGLGDRALHRRRLARAHQRPVGGLDLGGEAERLGADQRPGALELALGEARAGGQHQQLGEALRHAQRHLVGRADAGGIEHRQRQRGVGQPAGLVHLGAGEAQPGEGEAQARVARERGAHRLVGAQHAGERRLGHGRAQVGQRGAAALGDRRAGFGEAAVGGHGRAARHGEGARREQRQAGSERQGKPPSIRMKPPRKRQRWGRISRGGAA
jgi:hypothetical protein